MPAPQALPYSQDFSILTGAAPVAFPDGWQAWQVAGAAPSSAGRTTAPTGDKAINVGTAASTGSGAYDFNGKIGFLSVASSDVTLCLAINTTGNNNMQIKFDAMTIRNLWDGISTSGFQNGLVLQYRIGTSGVFTPLAYAPEEYLSGTTVQTTGVNGINPVYGLNAFLPAECENQPIVHVRWIYRNVPGGTSGSRPSMALDNIDIKSVPVTFVTGWPKAENPTASGFTAKTNINTPGTTYFIILPAGSTAPTSAQVKAGQDANGIALAANFQGTIVSVNGNAEELAAVSGLMNNTAYDVYFVAQGNSDASLQTTPQKVTVSTTNTTLAPTVLDPSVTSITSDAATLGGDITSDGGSPITDRGTIWGTSTGVTLSDNFLSEGGVATGLFSHNRTSLPPKTQIFFKAYATNGVGTSLSTESSFYTMAIQPTSSATNFTATATGSTTVDLTWDAVSDADGYLILIRSGSTNPGTAPSDLVVYNVGNSIGTGTVAAIVSSGATTTQTITGLSASTQYMFRIYPYGYDGANAETMNYVTLSQSSTATATTTVSTGIETLGSDVNISISQNNITINNAKNEMLHVFSMSGQLVKSDIIKSDNENVKLQKGFYIISVGNKRFKVLVNND